jgi:hypothetical protein
MIDTIEHIPEPARAIAELKRISRYTIFKVPLEDNLGQNVYNTITNGKVRAREFEHLGHVNFFNIKSIVRLIKSNGGSPIRHSFCNLYDYYLTSPYYQDMNRLNKTVNSMGRVTYKLSPKISSYIFPDCVMLLVQF